MSRGAVCAAHVTAEDSVDSWGRHPAVEPPPAAGWDWGGGTAGAESPATDSPPPPPPPGSPQRRRPVVLTLLAALAVIAGLAVGVPLGILTHGSNQGMSSSTGGSRSGSRASTAAQAKALYARVVAAASGSAGCHYVSVASGDASGQTIVGDAGPHGGTQLITLDSTYGHERFTLVLVNGVVYFQGNAAALQDQLGVPAASAPTVTTRWISVSSGDGPYGVVAPGITVGDQATEMALVPTSTLHVTAGGGVDATRIFGTVPPQQGAPAGTGHVDVPAGTSLPLTYVDTVSGNGVTITSTTTFADWGRPPSLPALPSNTIAWSKLGASMPPGGFGSGGTLTPTPTAGA